MANVCLFGLLVLEVEILPVAEHVAFDVFLANVTLVMEDFGHFARQRIVLRLSDGSNVTVDDVVGNEFEFAVEIAMDHDIVGLTCVAGVTNRVLIVLGRPVDRCRVQLRLHQSGLVSILAEVVQQNGTG